MWWLFEILSETEHSILYSYSRGNRLLDGCVSINKDTKEIELISPCEDDKDSLISQNKAVEKAYVMIRKGYPKHMQVACG